MGLRYPAACCRVVHFQRRRSETWRIIRRWVVVTVATFPAMAALFMFSSLFDELQKLIVFFGGFLVLLASIARISLTVSKRYRCPACGSVPRGRDGVLLDPQDCPVAASDCIKRHGHHPRFCRMPAKRPPRQFVISVLIRRENLNPHALILML